MQPDISQIKPGSVLLYNTPGNLVDEIITRTGPASHVEFYERDFTSLASRNGIGVGRYHFRTTGLIGVLVPIEPPADFVERFSDWFATVNGEGYDWRGLAGFVVDSVTQSQAHWFCSAFVAKGCEMAGCPVFNPFWSPSLITPSDFFKTPLLHWAWCDVAQLYDKSS